MGILDDSAIFTAVIQQGGFSHAAKYIKIDLVLSNNQLDPIKEQLDLVIRGAGFISEPRLQDSSMQMKLLLKDKIGLYASPSYLHRHEEPKYCTDLSSQVLINYSFQHRLQEEEKWPYIENELPGEFTFEPSFNANDIEAALTLAFQDLA